MLQFAKNIPKTGTDWSLTDQLTLSSGSSFGLLFFLPGIERHKINLRPQWKQHVLLAGGWSYAFLSEDCLSHLDL